jgi:hypothetical protein
MKKLLFSFIIVAAGVFVTSCGNKSAETATEAEQTEQVAEEAPAAEAEQPASLADIVAKAKAEGANWSADEWKAQFKTALEAYKPFAVAMNEAQPAELEEISKKYADYPALMKELAGIAKQAEGGKDITDEWIQTTMKELGVPEL